MEANFQWRDLKSSNYPENYNNNEDCGVLIHSDYGDVRLELVDFNTEHAYDKVEIYDGMDASAPLLATYTGSVHNETLVSNGSYLYFKFTSDVLTNLPGFYFRFKSGWFILIFVIICIYRFSFMFFFLQIRYKSKHLFEKTVGFTFLDIINIL